MTKRARGLRGDAPVLARLIELAQEVPLPGQGRLLHHLRQGRLAEAMRVCSQARLQCWQKGWRRLGASQVFQARLAVLEARLLQYVQSISSQMEL